LDLGDVVVESFNDNLKRVDRVFGAHCKRALGGGSTMQPPSHAGPLRLRKAANWWEEDETWTPPLPGAVALTCVRVVQKRVGVYQPSGLGAYDERWDVAVVLRDGAVLRNSLSEPAPKQAPVSVGAFSADTGQATKLAEAAAVWLKDKLAAGQPAAP
jgi:hypothetical protein